MSESNFGKYLFAFIGGAIAGAAAGILLAPDTGKNTRHKIAKKTRNITKSVEDKIEDMKASVSDLMDEIKEAAENLAHDAEKDIHQCKKQ